MTMIEPDIGQASRSRQDRKSSGVLPESFLAKFGSPRARPRLIQVYDPKTGWSTDRRKAVVTIDLLAELRAAGITLVEAKWRKHRRQINLSNLDIWSQA
jgi:hypothetical protein